MGEGGGGKVCGDQPLLPSLVVGLILFKYIGQNDKKYCNSNKSFRIKIHQIFKNYFSFELAFS